MILFKFGIGRSILTYPVNWCGNPNIKFLIEPGLRVAPTFVLHAFLKFTFNSTFVSDRGADVNVVDSCGRAALS